MLVVLLFVVLNMLDAFFTNTFLSSGSFTEIGKLPLVWPLINNYIIRFFVSFIIGMILYKIQFNWALWLLNTVFAAIILWDIIFYLLYFV